MLESGILFKRSGQWWELCIVVIILFTSLRMRTILFKLSAVMVVVSIIIPAQAHAATFSELMTKLEVLQQLLRDTQNTPSPRVLGQSVTTVTTSAELNLAIAKATGGETVQLAPGVYGQLKVLNKTYTSPVTFTSLDPNNRAVISSFNILASNNVVIDGINVKYTYPINQVPPPVTWTKINEIKSAQNCVFRNMQIVGDVDASGYGALYAIDLTGSSYITIEKNLIKNWNIGIVNAKSSNIVINNNEFTHISGDGLENAQVKFVTISNNYFHDFLRHPTSNIHPDMIQFWTMGTNVPSTDVTIIGNRLDIGNGSWTQSIFMRNEAVDMGTLPASQMNYRNFRIENNTITNVHLHGITLGEADGVIIRGNTLTSALPSVNTDPVTLNYLKSYPANNPIFSPSIRPSFYSKNVLVENNTFLGQPANGPTNLRLTGYVNQPDWTVRNNTNNGVLITGGVSTPTVTLTSSLTSVTVGASTTLSWNSTQATTCTASGDWIGTKSTSGSMSTGILTTSGTKTYTLTCTGIGGSATQVASVVVNAVVPVPVGTTPFASGTRVAAIAAVNVRATAGGSILGAQASGTSGTAQGVAPINNTGLTYQFVNFDSGIDGWVATSFLKKTVVVVAQPITPTLTFTSNLTQVATGKTAILSWSTTNATACISSGTWDPGARATAGTFTSYPFTTKGTRTYTLTCTGAGGTVSKSVMLNVVLAVVDTDHDTVPDSSDNCPLAANPDQANFDLDTQGDVCDADDDNDGILDTNERSGCSLDSSLACGVPVAPTLTFTSNLTQVATGKTAILSWSTTNATACISSGTWDPGARATAGTFTSYPFTTKGTRTYTLTCTGAGGTVSKSVMLNVVLAEDKTVTVNMPAAVSPVVSSTVTHKSVVTLDTVRVRTSPNGTILGTQNKGASGTLMADSEIYLDGHFWVKVNFANGPDGYVAKEFLSEGLISVLLIDQLKSLLTSLQLQTVK